MAYFELHPTPSFDLVFQTYFGGRQPVTSRVAQWLITRFILARARASSGLDVMVEARSNREAVKGRFDAVTVQFDELTLDTIQVTYSDTCSQYKICSRYNL